MVLISTMFYWTRSNQVYRGVAQRKSFPFGAERLGCQDSPPRPFFVSGVVAHLDSERRSTKPEAAGSSPASPTII